MNFSAVESKRGREQITAECCLVIQKRFLPASDKGNRWLPATSVLYLSCPAQWGGMDCGSQEIQVRGNASLYQTCKLEFEFYFEFCTLTHRAIGNSVFLDLWFKPTWDAARLLLTLSTVWIGRSLWGANGPFLLFSAPWARVSICVGGGKVCNVKWQFQLPKVISVQEAVLRREMVALSGMVSYTKLKSLFSWHLPGALPQCKRVLSTSLPHKTWWQAFIWKNWELFWCCSTEGHYYLLAQMD